jgi:hypothetical protein
MKFPSEMPNISMGKSALKAKSQLNSGALDGSAAH